MEKIAVYRVTSRDIRPIEAQAATLDEWTLQLPQGVYTTFRTYDPDKRVLGLKAHLKRLYQPTGQTVKPQISVEDLRIQLRNVLETCPGDVRVRLVMTREGDVFLGIIPLAYLSPAQYREGIKVITVQLQRGTPRIKSTKFISASKKEREEISQTKAYEALLVYDGAILEGITSNFFYGMQGRLGTAQEGILLGVTRRIIIKIAKGRGVEVFLRPLKTEKIPFISEAFITSSSRGIVPVVKIDDVRVGEGVPGPLTKLLMESYTSYVEKYAEMI